MRWLVSDSVAGVFEELLSADGVLVPSADEPWTVRGRTPDVVALPADEEQVAASLRIAHERGWPVVPAGAGRRVEAQAASREGPLVVLSVTRLREVVHYEPADLSLRAGAGLSLGELGESVRTEGQWLGLDPPGSPGRTLGGALAGCEHGPLHAGVGRPRDQVLGLVLVSGDGRVLRLGGDVVKNVAGFDLVKLVVGSRGSLGVITEASVRLHPLPEVDTTVIVPCSSVAGGLAALRAAAAGPHPLAALELFTPPPSTALVPAAARALVAARVMGTRRSAMRVLDSVRKAFSSHGEVIEPEGLMGGDLFRLAGGREENALIGIRVGALPSHAEAALGPILGYLGEAEAASESREGSSRSWVHIHGTTGTLRFGMERGESDEGEPRDELERETLSELGRALRREGASLRAVRIPASFEGVAAEWGASSGVQRIARQIERVFDPAGILVEASP